MKIYHYNDSGYYIDSSVLGEADKSPLEPGKYLIPGKATTAPPPKAKEKYLVKWDGQKWIHEEIAKPEEKEGHEIVWNSEKQEYEHIKLPPTLAELKVAKWEDIKTRRNVAEMSGCPYMGGVLDTDPVSVQRISIAALTAQAAIATAQPFALDWTMKDNSVVTMSAEAVAGMPVALAMYSNRLHQTARELRAQIDAATSAEELAAVQWTESEA